MTRLTFDSVRRSLQPVFVTGSLLLFPFAILAGDPTRETLIKVLFLMPCAIFYLVAVLGFKLNQRRITMLGLGLIMFCAFLQSAYLRSFLPVTATETAKILALGLPIFYISLFLLPQKWLTGRREWPFLVVACVPSVAGQIGLVVSVKWREILHWQLFKAPLLGVPDVAVAAALVFGVLSYFERDRFLKDFRVFAGLTFIPFFYVLAAPATRAPLSEMVRIDLFVMFLSSSLMLLYGILRLYWQKVYFDELTTIPNRRALNDRLPKLSGNFCIAMVDIDHFKTFNDTYGHEEGDHVLRFVAQFAKRVTNDRAYRYGGEEFCVVFEDCSHETAFNVMEDLRTRLAAATFHIRKPRNPKDKGRKNRGKGNTTGKTVHVTISIGLGIPADGSISAEDVLTAADGVLYQAKERGRNCTVVTTATATKRKAA